MAREVDRKKILEKHTYCVEQTCEKTKYFSQYQKWITLQKWKKCRI